jgi:polyribonucleotide nucleotidyltransferase
LIGPGGKIIQEIQASTGTTIVIEEIGNMGKVEVVASNKDSIEAAVKRIKGIVAVPEIGEIYKGKVKAIFEVPGMEKIILVKHGEYFTVYAKLQDVQVKIGQ